MQLVKFILFPGKVGQLWNHPSTVIVSETWGTFGKKNALSDTLRHWTEEYIHTHIYTYIRI